MYGRQRKHQLKPLQDFDPRPVDLRETANENLKDFLKKVHGQGLGVSLLKDEQSRCWSSSFGTYLAPVLPTKSELQEQRLVMPSLKLREIEQSTRDQSDSPLWHSVRQYHQPISRSEQKYFYFPCLQIGKKVLLWSKSGFVVLWVVVLWA